MRHPRCTFQDEPEQPTRAGLDGGRQASVATGGGNLTLESDDRKRRGLRASSARRLPLLHPGLRDVGGAVHGAASRCSTREVAPMLYVQPTYTRGIMLTERDKAWLKAKGKAEQRAEQHAAYTKLSTKDKIIGWLLIAVIVGAVVLFFAAASGTPTHEMVPDGQQSRLSNENIGLQPPACMNEQPLKCEEEKADAHSEAEGAKEAEQQKESEKRAQEEGERH
ncbi:MAG: hypothetical protein ABSB69_17965 [Solirubrobacteraceae bacterium]